MIENYFDRITHNSRPHEDFSKSWGSYSSTEFVKAFLPHVNTHNKEYLDIYDGAELFDHVPNKRGRFFSLGSKKKLARISIFTFAAGQLADNETGKLQPLEDELFLTATVNSDSTIKLKFKFGRNFRNQLNEYLINIGVKDSLQRIENRTLTMSKTEFKSKFSKTTEHADTINYIVESLGVDKKSIANYNRNLREQNITDLYGIDIDGFELVNFDAGPPDPHFKNSWTHYKIEKVALSEAGFTKEDIAKIYYGNWLRDFSSSITGAALGIDATTKQKLIDSTLFNSNPYFVSLAAGTTGKPTHDGWVKIIELFAAKVLVYDINPTDERGEDFQQYIDQFRNTFGGELTKDVLGVYRPEEHIDNPKDLKDESLLGHEILGKAAIVVNKKIPDSDDIKQTLSRGETKEGTELEIGVDGLKRYIRENTLSGPEVVPSSLAYFEQQIRLAAEKGRNQEGFSHFGAALHVLEDYYAHSNFVEITLIKIADSIDKRSILTYPWVQISENTKNISVGMDKALEIPIVTGLFGTTDMHASMAPKIANFLFPTKKSNLKKVNAGDRTLTNHLIILVLSDYVRQEIDLSYEEKSKFTPLNLTYEELLTAYRRALAVDDVTVSANDSLNSWIDEIIPGYKETREWLDEEIHDLSQDLSYYPNLIMNRMFSGQTQNIKDEQTANKKDYGTNPTHTQIAKDHLQHLLNPLAGMLGVFAVKKIGTIMKEYWNTESSVSLNKILNLAKTTYFVHPTQTEWMDEYVIAWAKKYPDVIKKVKNPKSNEHKHDYDISKFENLKEVEKLYPINGKR